MNLVIFFEASSGHFRWIGRYEKKRESFDLFRDLFAAKFESGAVRFSGKMSLRRWSPSVQNKDSSLVLLLLGTVNGELKLLQNC